MKLFAELQRLVAITHIHNIARRYLVVNGFDGALTSLGLLSGFYFHRISDLGVIITACLGAAIALGMSGFSSAYVSEAAERKLEFKKLQDAMVTDISGSSHDKASRWMPFFVAMVNGLSPLIISLLILIPLWMAQHGIALLLNPLLLAMIVAFVIIFLLGVFLSNVSGSFWLLSGLKTLVIAGLTFLLIYLIS